MAWYITKTVNSIKFIFYVLLTLREVPFYDPPGIYKILNMVIIFSVVKKGMERRRVRPNRTQIIIVREPKTWTTRVNSNIRIVDFAVGQFWRCQRIVSSPTAILELSIDIFWATYAPWMLEYSIRFWVFWSDKLKQFLKYRLLKIDQVPSAITKLLLHFGGRSTQG